MYSVQCARWTQWGCILYSVHGGRSGNVFCTECTVDAVGMYSVQSVRWMQWGCILYSVYGGCSVHGGSSGLEQKRGREEFLLDVCGSYCTSDWQWVGKVEILQRRHFVQRSLARYRSLRLMWKTGPPLFYKKNCHWSALAKIRIYGIAAAAASGDWHEY